MADIPFVPENKLIAYADGVLPPAEMAEVEAALTRSPALTKRVARIKHTRERAASAFDDTFSQPISPDVLKAAAGLGAPPQTRLPYGPIIGGIAAIIAGFLLGRISVPSALSPDSPRLAVATPRGTFAGPELSRFLDSAEAGQVMILGRNLPARVILTFASHGGALCRQFEAGPESNLTNAVACRDADAWRIEVMASRTPSDGKPLANVAPEPVNVTIDSIIAGAPYDSAQERAAIAAHWK